MLKQRKSSPRLCSFDYSGPYAYFVTCSTYQKRPYFKEKAVIDTVMPLLKRLGTQNSFTIYAYCFMPDHLHLLLLGEDKSSLHTFMKTFKQETSFKFRRTCNSPLWHRSYYDHVLRKEEALEEVALYILNNPVRAGLVDDYRSYAFSGSFVFDTNVASRQT
ncbi:MAG: transposase [Chloroflexi bacterium]|nr:transposase [Chloroflexota bacterium]